MSRFYHLHFYVPPVVSSNSIKEHLDLHEDWYLLSENSYILFTKMTPSEIAKHLSAMTRIGGQYLLTNFDPQFYNGKMPTEFWDWLLKCLQSYHSTKNFLSRHLQDKLRINVGSTKKASE